MATQQDIARVALELEEAEATVTAMRRKRFISSEAGAAYSAAKGRIELATAELERLNAEYEAEQLALANRPAVEKAAAKDISAASLQLEASRKTLTDAATRAQRALVDLAAAAEAHSALIAQHSAALTARGLGLQDNHEHLTGGIRSGLRIRGTWWLPVEPSSLLVWVLHRAAVAAFTDRHSLPGLLKFSTGRQQLDARADGLLRDVPNLPARPAVAPPRGQHARVSPARVYIDSRSRAEQDLQAELLGYKEIVKAASGELYTKAAEAPESVKAGIAARLKRLDEDIKSGRIVVKYQ
ncbi:hypothetical protein [Streptomyces lavendulae]|uniref:hypothetical protein n=1 Tax=Streptomyces lavendulae TaxID=1914 RepID=UPI0033DD5476